MHRLNLWQHVAICSWRHVCCKAASVDVELWDDNDMRICTCLLQPFLPSSIKPAFFGLRSCYTNMQNMQIYTTRGWSLAHSQYLIKVVCPALIDNPYACLQLPGAERQRPDATPNDSTGCFGSTSCLWHRDQFRNECYRVWVVVEGAPEAPKVEGWFTSWLVRWPPWWSVPFHFGWGTF